MQGQRQTEQYRFYCQPCNYEWQMSYEVRPGAEPGEREFFYRYGLPASPPSAGRLCPNCWAPSQAGELFCEPALASSHH